MGVPIYFVILIKTDRIKDICEYLHDLLACVAGVTPIKDLADAFKNVI